MSEETLSISAIEKVINNVALAKDIHKDSIDLALGCITKMIEHPDDTCLDELKTMGINGFPSQIVIAWVHHRDTASITAGEALPLLVNYWRREFPQMREKSAEELDLELRAYKRFIKEVIGDIARSGLGVGDPINSLAFIKGYCDSHDHHITEIMVSLATEEQKQRIERIQFY